MIVSFSQVIGSDVLSVKEQKAVARVCDIVIQKTDLKIKAVLLSASLFSFAKKVITFDDISEFDTNAVVIQNEDDIVPLGEVVTVEQAIKSKLHGVGQKVMTKSKKMVGNVYDYTFDSESGLIYALHVRYLLTDRVINRASIIEISSNIFIIEDDFELVKNSAVGEAAEA